jgi:chromosome segregation ATPase
MLGVNVDTFPAYRQLKNAGFTEVQAEALISSFKNLNEELAKNLITREEFNLAIAELKALIEKLEGKIQAVRGDMNSMEARLEAKMDSIEERLETKMNSIKERLETKMNSMEERMNNKMEVLAKDLTIKIGYMIAGSIGLIVALIKLL